MNSHNNFHSKSIIHQPLELPHLPPPFKRGLEILTHYDTPKIVRFESKWIATLSLMIKLSFASVCIYLMFQPSSYQVYDHSPISAVTINVEPSNCSINASIMSHFKLYNCSQSAYDVNDFILPAIENSAVSITIRTTEIEYILTYCSNETIRNKVNRKNLLPYAATRHHCYNVSQCVLPPFYRKYYENDTSGRKPQLCWYKLPHENNKTNYQALDYILFIKNFVEFPQLKTTRDNLLSDTEDKNFLKTCEYDNATTSKNNSCPKFRILKILEMVESDTEEYESMFINGSLIEIKIIWECNLDHDIKDCKPKYAFKRLDNKPYKKHPFIPGSTFFTQRSFFQPNSDRLSRIHTKIYNLHIIVSVTGAVGRRDLFQITTSIGSFIGIFSTGKIVCDLIAAFITNFKRVKYER